MKRIFFLLALAGTLPAFAQKTAVPGYLGKRFYVGINGSSFIHFERDQADEVQLGNFPLNTRFSYKTEVTASYVLNRKVSAGLTFTYAQQKAYFGILGVQVDAPPPYPPGPFVQNVMPVSDGTEFGRFKYSFYSVQAHLKIFRRNFIAPAGRYHYLGLGYLRYVPFMAEPGQVLIQPVDNSLQPFGPSYTQPMTKNGQFGTYRITYMMGRMTPINKFFFINTAFGINLFVGGDHLTAFVNSGNNAVATIQDAMVSVLHRNLQRHNTFEVKLGIGFYAF
ncbi:MAG: hypothetical protein MUC87_14620 [Bacteroidia bacterium]|jgi:hypothetical protein|nr:hypothetical protein [Bacteroidia bacterium]